MSDDFINNLTSLTDKTNDIAFTRYATITTVNNDGTVNCKDDDDTIHKNVINSTNLQLSKDDTVLLGFIDNDIYQPMVTGGVNVKCGDDTLIYALGLGKFNIDSNGDLIYNLPIGITNYASINSDGDLIIDLNESENSKFRINNEGEVIYG